VSRIGKRLIPIPAGVEVKIEDRLITAKGPKGENQWTFDAEMSVVHKGDHLIVEEPQVESKKTKSLWGMTNVMISNLIEGVSKGFEKVLEITGVGYSAEIKGKSMQLNLGYSHPTLITPPDDIKLEIPKNLTIKVSGIDKQKVGQIAAKIRSVRSVEPYKGKGIRYQGEAVRRKAGKKVGS